MGYTKHHDDATGIYLKLDVLVLEVDTGGIIVMLGVSHHLHEAGGLLSEKLHLGGLLASSAVDLLDTLDGDADGLAVLLGWCPAGGAPGVLPVGGARAGGGAATGDVPLGGGGTTLLVSAGLGRTVVGEVVDVASDHEGGDVGLLTGLDVGLHIRAEGLELLLGALARGVHVACL